MKHSPIDWWQRARPVQRGHAIGACVWAVLLIPTLLWWRDSVLWVAAMSLYANIGVHLAGATRSKK